VFFKFVFGDDDAQLGICHYLAQSLRCFFRIQGHEDATCRHRGQRSHPLVQATLQGLYRGLNDPPFNYFIHSAPLKGDYAHEYHWHLEIIPKLSIAAGFELGTGMWINVVKPEDSAAFLRERIETLAREGSAA